MSKQIHVIIDGRMISEELHGIARYTYELIKRGSQTGKLYYLILVNDLHSAKKIFHNTHNIEFIHMKSKFLSIGEQIELPFLINKYKGKAIFHSPSFVSSPLIKTKMIMTIHDLNHIKFPEFYSKFHKYYYEYIVRPAAIKSEYILTVSHFSKTEITQWLKYENNDKVIVTYNGIDNKFIKLNDKIYLQKIKEKYQLPDEFILYIGNLKQHKNVETLIKSMKYISNKELYLVINGKPNKRIEEIVQEYNLMDKVCFIGYVGDEDLPAVYNMAKVFVFPSLYEGFGLPPLEAMACGCPAIVSDRASLPEVVGEGGCTFHATDERDLSIKIDSLIASKEMYNAQVIYGKQRSMSFTWDKMISKTLEIYNRII